MAIRYFHAQVMSIVTIVLAGFFILAPASSHSEQENSVDTTVQYLLDYVATSGLTFIRNSDQYTAREASRHMQKKYAHFEDKIDSPEKFIELCATKSLLSGKPYMVVNKQGEAVRTSEWLSAALDNYVAAQRKPAQ